ncbi:hypothetical protein ACFQU2_40495 [Siccirubricoccus deserti]
MVSQSLTYHYGTARLAQIGSLRTYVAGRVYAACRRPEMDEEWPYPQHGQWGAALPLAICGADMQAGARC